MGWKYVSRDGTRILSSEKIYLLHNIQEMGLRLEMHAMQRMVYYEDVKGSVKNIVVS